MTDEVKRLVIEGASVLDIKKVGLEQGMITLRRCGILNAARGVTSIEEVLNVTMGD
jgi:type IV pilus assembly protein PilB